MTDAGTAVLLTPSGLAAIAVVRLSGPGNADFAARHLTKPPKAMRCVHCDLHDAGEVIDDIVVVLTDDGHLDLNLHGGAWVVQATLNLAERHGYRLLSWQETPAASEAADDIEHQVLLDLPRAKSRAVLRLLAAQPRAWKAMLADRDARAIALALTDVALERALAVPTVAIVGPPNVGKSTLANALFAREHSITADVPGTTRDWVGELADIDGLVVKLIDTPGIRDTTDPIEEKAIERASGVVAGAEIVVVAIDGSRPLDAAERVVLESMWSRDPILVRTKFDCPKRCDADIAAIDICALTGDGLAELRRAIRHRSATENLHSLHARCWTDGQRYKLRSLVESSCASY